MVSRKLIRGLQKYLKKSKLILPGDSDWSEVNQRFGIHKMAPLALLKAKEWKDLQQSIRYCNQNKISYAVKGGGVNQAASCVRNNALTLDLSELKQISHLYDGRQLQISFEAGVNFQDLNKYIQKFNKQQRNGFVTPLTWYDQISCIGAFSIFGNGLFHRKIGFGVDLITQAKVLLSSGEIITANQRENSDILWAIRGCGPHIGAILQMTIKMENQTFNCLKIGESKNVKTHFYQIPFDSSVISLENDFLNYLSNLDARFLCYFGFGGNYLQSNIYLFLTQLLTNNLPETNLNSESKQGKELKSIIQKYKGKNMYKDKQFMISDFKALNLPKPKKKIYKVWGFYTTSSQFKETMQTIFYFYLKNPINFADKQASFNFSVNYLGCEKFSKRDSTKTSMPALKEENFLIYGNISYSDQNIGQQVNSYMQRFQKSLEGKMPLGSPCDFDPEKARINPQIGKWIYRQNYERLITIKSRIDPSNSFNYGLFDLSP